MFVKICGVTRADDAAAAVAAGASAVGFIFWPQSPRFVDPYRARAIAASLPPFVTPVGVFVDQPLDYVSGVASLVHLGAVQLHGNETPEFGAALRRPIVKAIVRSESGAFDLDRWAANVMILLDAHDPVKRGGTGTIVDWTAAAGAARRRRVLLAGGLTPDNVGEAIASVRPFGIDVSSGVESSPGVKNHERIAALFAAIRSAEGLDATHHVSA